MSGKLERFFRTFKLWFRAMLRPQNPRALQRRLDNYRHWYNEVRCHSALKGRTPEQVWLGIKPPEPIPIRQADPVHVAASVKRHAYGGDPRLPVVDIQIVVHQRRAA